MCQSPISEWFESTTHGCGIIHSFLKYVPVAQSVEQRTFNALVKGSNPFGRTQYAPLAQQVEHFLGKEEVMGSNPIGCSSGATTLVSAFTLVTSK